jgi:5-methylcytosine-specific restriction protein A
MPFRAARPCAHPGCRATAANGRFCSAHAVSVRATRPYDAWRGSSHSRGYDAAWRRVRVEALERDQFECQDCLKRSILKRATDVHHIIPVDVAPHLRLVLANLVSLCHECHSSITATRDSTFARRFPTQLL